jgi:hypothetical protein
VALPSGLGTAKDLCFEHANELINVSGQYRTKFSFKYNCGFSTAYPYVVAFTLVPQLGSNPRASEHFTKACQYIWEYVPKLDVLRYSLRALEALALIYNVQIPSDALQYFQDLDIDDTVLENVPITLVTTELPPPQLSQLRSSSREEINQAKLKIDAESMRDLLARWSSLRLRMSGSRCQLASADPASQQMPLQHSNTI